MKKQHMTSLIVLVIVVIIVCLIGGPMEGFATPSNKQKQMANMGHGGMIPGMHGGMNGGMHGMGQGSQMAPMGAPMGALSTFP